MKAFTCTFIKKDNSERKINFCKLSDISKVFPGFLEARIGNSGIEKNVADGMELVYELDVDNFRYVNYNTIIGEIKEIEIPDDIFYE